MTVCTNKLRNIMTHCIPVESTNCPQVNANVAG